METPILYLDFVEQVLPAFSMTDTPKDSACSICLKEYGDAETKEFSALTYFNELPEAIKTYVPMTVEPATTVCGHSFCTTCILTWARTKPKSNCPMCRHAIALPARWRPRPDPYTVAVNGIRIAYKVSITAAREMWKLSNMLTIRQLITTNEYPSFRYDTHALLLDLPSLMVSIARRFHYQQLHQPIPEDPNFEHIYKLIAARNKIRTRTLNMQCFSLPDALLANHPHSRECYMLLCELIRRGGNIVDGSYFEGRRALIEVLLMRIKAKLGLRLAGAASRLDGGLGSERWWAYITCVLKALFARQAIHQRIEILQSP